jgi:hypothetical protein
MVKSDVPSCGFLHCGVHCQSHTYIPLMVHPRRSSRNISDIPPRHPYFTDMTYLRASECTLSRWSQLHLQSLATTNPHWAHMVRNGSFSLCVINEEGLPGEVSTVKERFVRFCLLFITRDPIWLRTGAMLILNKLQNHACYMHINVCLKLLYLNKPH